MMIGPFHDVRECCPTEQLDPHMGDVEARTVDKCRVANEWG